MAMRGRVGGRAAAANSTRIQDVAEGALAANGDRRPGGCLNRRRHGFTRPITRLSSSDHARPVRISPPGLVQELLDVSGRLIPNDKGAFQSIGLDSLAGLVVLGACVAARFAARVPAIPNILAKADPPWRVPREAKKQLGATTATYCWHTSRLAMRPWCASKFCCCCRCTMYSHHPHHARLESSHGAPHVGLHGHAHPWIKTQALFPAKGSMGALAHGEQLGLVLELASALLFNAATSSTRSVDTSGLGFTCLYIHANRPYQCTHVHVE